MTWVDQPHVLMNSRGLSSGTHTYDYDFSAYQEVTWWVMVEGTTGTPSAFTVDAVINQKDPSHLLNDSQARWTAIASSSITQITSSTGFGRTQLTSTSLSGRVQLSIAVDFTGGSTPTAITTVVATLKG